MKLAPHEVMQAASRVTCEACRNFSWENGSFMQPVTLSDGTTHHPICPLVRPRPPPPRFA